MNSPVNPAKKVASTPKSGATNLLLYLLGVILLHWFIYLESLHQMLSQWERPEYSHGYMIPFISFYLFLRALPEIVTLPRSGTFWGFIIVCLSALGYLLGELSTLFTIVQYSFVFSLVGFAIILLGLPGVWKSAGAFVYLIFMIPLPDVIYFPLSSELQLISSKLGVTTLRLFDISVFLEGNVIDLGSYKLQVVEACSGLRYLFPLMSFGFLVACLYEAPMWQKVIIFISTVPITIFMNSFRIAFIGITVEHWGIEAAEGFIHDFEGWVVFMACLGILALEILILHKITRQPGSPLDRLDVSLPDFKRVSGAMFRG